MTYRVAIIGSAGRRTDGAKLNWNTYIKMYLCVRNKYIRLFRKNQKITAVSGGAAWADHIAISLYLANEVDELELHFPCRFDMENCRFHDEGDFKIKRQSSGNVANYYHKLFSNKIKGNTLFGIKKAIIKGATFTVSQGFRNRNKKVATSNYMIALTFSEGNRPNGGGTAHTWNSSGSITKIHIPIGTL